MDCRQGLPGSGSLQHWISVNSPPDTEYGDPLTSQIYTAPQAYKAAANEKEVATWSEVRDPNTTYPWGIEVFDVDPGQGPGSLTSISMTYYHTPAATASNLYPAPLVYDSFTAVRPRRDGLLSATGRTSRPAVLQA